MEKKDWILLAKIAVKITIAVSAYYILGNTLVLYQGF
jgi:hypothetical protein